MTGVALLCSESPISLAIIRELGAHGIAVRPVVRKAHSFLISSRYADGAILRPDGPVRDWLPELALREGFDWVMAVGEADVLALAEMKAGGSALRIAAPPLDQMRIVLDKQTLMNEAEAVGIAVPRTWQPDSADPYRWLTEDVQFPLVAKWSDPLAVTERLKAAGIAVDKVVYLHNETELEDCLGKYDTVGLYPLVQEYIPGHGLGQMFHAADGQATLRFQHRRLREWPLSGGVSSLCEAVPLGLHADLRARSEALLKRLRWTGPAMVEFRHDPATGRSVLMEINGRFWGSLPLASAAGVQFGWETYRHAFGAGEVEPQPDYPHRKARYMAPELKNLRDVWRGDGALGTKLAFSARFFAAFLDPSVRYYVFALRDPRPFFADIRNIVTRT